MAAPTMIGLDIGTTSIRAVEISRAKDGLVLTNFAVEALPHGVVQAGVVVDADAVTATLKQMWATARLRCRKVVLGVTNAQAIVREMSVANLPARELRASLPFQVRDSLPLPPERSVLDFHPLEDATGKETVRGLLIAAPKEAVLVAVRAVERAGLYVTRVDVASFALLRAAATPEAGVEALVDIGARTTTVVVHSDGVPLIVRTIPRGGAEITDQLVTRLSVPAEEAEAIKVRVGLRAEENAELAETIADATRPLISEVRSSFAYLDAGDRQKRVTRVVLSGGGALLQGLTETLHGQLGVPVTVANPTARMQRAHRTPKHDELARSRSRAAVSIGLTLGAAS
ncbi:MAG TPA: type IV pilus assembly protein PilM [Pilimelia sp.]|nr:type IV pilus assembly protein PilM [Pilimelia sp.]